MAVKSELERQWLPECQQVSFLFLFFCFSLTFTIPRWLFSSSLGASVEFSPLSGLSQNQWQTIPRGRWQIGREGRQHWTGEVGTAPGRGEGGLPSFIFFKSGLLFHHYRFNCEIMEATVVKSLSCPLQYLSSAPFSVATVLDSTERVSLLGLGSLKLGNCLSQTSLRTTKKCYQIFSKSACQWGFWLMTLLVTDFLLQIISRCGFGPLHFPGGTEKRATCKSINATFVSTCPSFCFQAITLLKKIWSILL